MDGIKNIYLVKKKTIKIGKNKCSKINIDAFHSLRKDVSIKWMLFKKIEIGKNVCINNVEAYI